MKKNFSVSSPLQMSEVLGKMCKSMKKTLTSSELAKSPAKHVITDEDRKQAQKEVVSGLSSHHQQTHGLDSPAYGERTGHQIKGGYRRSGSRGTAFDATSKEKEKHGQYQSGVHKPALRHPDRPGDSEIGHKLRSENPSVKAYSKGPIAGRLHALLHSDDFNDVDYNKGKKVVDEAKQHHTNVLRELKDMPKPKLTRSELEKFDQHLQKSWKPKSIKKASPAPAPAPKPAQPAMPKMKPAKMKQPTIKAPAPKAPDMQMSEHEKGVHKPVKAMGLKGGMSHAGLDARVAKEPSVQNHPVAQISLDESKAKHKEKLSELKQMPKPKLTKADIEAFDQKLQSMKKKP